LAEELTLASAVRMLRKAGAKRVSREAGEELRRALGEFGMAVAREAVRYALSSGRTTVSGRDVRDAVRRVFGQRNVHAR